jgi:hypothetical protein
VIHVTGEKAVDRFLSDDPLALLIAMVLDQQVRKQQSVFRGKR